MTAYDYPIKWNPTGHVMSVHYFGQIDIIVPLTAVKSLKKIKNKIYRWDLKNLKYWKISILIFWLIGEQKFASDELNIKSINVKFSKYRKVFSKIPNWCESNKNFKFVADDLNFSVKNSYTTCPRNQKLILFLKYFFGLVNYLICDEHFLCYLAIRCDREIGDVP